jgi:preprotein translocase subunit SecD
MKHQSKRLFVALLFFIGALISISLPENYPLKFSIGSFHIDRMINPVSIDLNIFGLKIHKQFTTQLGLDLSGGTHVTLEAQMDAIEESDRQNALESAKSVIERRVNFLGVSEPLVQTSIANKSYRIIVELPGITQTDRAMAVIGQTAQLEFREFTDERLATDSSYVQFAAFASPSALLAGSKETGLTGKDLKRALLQYSTENGEPIVAVQFTQDGGKKFAELTKRLVGKPLPIFLDGFLISNPIVNQEITNGEGVIQGGFSTEQAKFLVNQLNAGALPVPIKVVEQRVVEASLGKDSVDKSVRAGVIGLLFVAGFMIALYGGLGIISVFGLLTYGLITFALYRAIPITLTLPGITGFILSMGMAVDSNILIFDRYKEEKRAGKPWRIAMEQAFGKAWDSIRDANITTLITCLILFNPLNWQFLPTSGLVRGFAITLFLGVLVSLFTGLFVTRTFIRVLYREKE